MENNGRKWYYMSNDVPRGPYAERQIRDMIEDGQIKKKMLVRPDNSEGWSLTIETELASSFDGGEELTVVECEQCRKKFLSDELIEIGGIQICEKCKPMLLQKFEEGKTADLFHKYGGLWQRCGALFLDGIILQLANIPLTLLLAFIIFGQFTMSPTSGNGPFSSGILTFQGLNMFISFLIAITYSVWFVVNKGATLGKMASGLIIINTDGSEGISKEKAIGRFLLKNYVSGILTLGIGYLIAVFDDKKRTLHDRICNTRVIKKQ
ncbi:MAG: RDD family protein [Verrucomicrobiota bacterium]|nr:RDD family protein [Verrucomicrobiota bacterium]